MIQNEAWSKVKIHLYIKISYKEVKDKKVTLDFEII
jgi:hypothetical protein